MKRALVAVIFMIGLTSSGRTKHENGGHIVLPNSELLRCRSSGCFQLWEDNSADANAIYPRQVMIDIFGDGNCPRGVMALYEKSVSTDELKEALDQRYGKWGLADNATSPVKLWRVESRKFAIQLATTQKRKGKLTRDEARGEALSRGFGYGDRSDVTEAGMKSVIYIAFVGTTCGSQ